MNSLNKKIKVTVLQNLLEWAGCHQYRISGIIQKIMRRLKYLIRNSDFGPENQKKYRDFFSIIPIGTIVQFNCIIVLMLNIYNVIKRIIKNKIRQLETVFLISEPAFNNPGN
jgi:hypothetical protein